MSRNHTIKGLGSLAGVVATTCYGIGDVLLLGGRIDPERHAVLQREDVDTELGAMLPASYGRLWAGALMGLAGPLFQFGVRDQARGISGGRGAGPGGHALSADARLVEALLTAGMGLAPFMHGSFGPMGQSLKAAQDALDAGADEATVDGFVAESNRILRALNLPYGIFFAVAGGATVIMTERIVRGRTDYPRWAAILVPPLWPIAAMSAITGSEAARGTALRPLRGAGLSLGLMVSYGASALLRRRR